MNHLWITERLDKFDSMMTKYSAFEHSQSTERPINLPELSEIETDIDDPDFCEKEVIYIISTE